MLYYIFVFFLVLITIICVVKVSLAPNPKKTILISIPELLIKVKTGDLIFFSGRSVAESAIRKYNNCPWSHVAMIVLVHDRPYVINVDTHANKKMRGTQFMSLTSKLSLIQKNLNYYKYIGWKQIMTSFTLDSQKIVNYTKEHQFRLDTKYITYFLGNNSWFYNRYKNPNKVTCSEFIAMVLVEFNLMIFPDTYHPQYSCYPPSDFWNDNFMSPPQVVWKKGEIIKF